MAKSIPEHLTFKTVATFKRSDDREDYNHMLQSAKRRHASESFDSLMIEGKRWFYSQPLPSPDQSISFFEKAVELKKTDYDARNYLARAHSNARLGNVAAHKTQAIAIFEETLKIFPAGSIEWATTNNNIACTLCEIENGDTEKNYRNAINAYQKALTVHTKIANPIYWATIQNNLGCTWKRLSTGDRKENLIKAIDAFESSLTVRTQTDRPFEWALTQTNLGSAWSEIPTGDKDKDLQRALAAFESASMVNTKSNEPAYWSEIQNNLGVLWAEIPTGNKWEDLQKAIDSHESALSVRNRDADSVAWATSKYNLATVLGAMPENPNQNSCQLLETAIAYSKEALEIFTPEAFPATNSKALVNLEIYKKMHRNNGCKSIVRQLFKRIRATLLLRKLDRELSNALDHAE